MVLRAHERTTAGLWDFIEGGTESETTVRRNRQALDSLALKPRVLRDVSIVNPATTYLGHPLSIPVMMAPVGSLALIDPGGALPVARACAATGTMMFYSTFAEPSVRQVTEAVPHPLILGLYVRDEGPALDRVIDEAKTAGCVAIGLVTEAAYYSRRERDLINQFLSKGSKPGSYADTQRTLRDGAPGPALDKARARMVPAHLDWKAVARIRARAGNLPIVLKGIADAADARIAVEEGVESVYVSNHGGRQLDYATGTLDTLVEVVDAVAGRAEVVVDGGIYRGTDVIKAIALGARAACIGRLQCWALAAGGEQALVRAIGILEEEIIIAMGLLGVTSVDKIDGSFLRAVQTIEPADMYNPFPLVKKALRTPLTPRGSLQTAASSG